MNMIFRLTRLTTLVGALGVMALTALPVSADGFHHGGGYYHGGGGYYHGAGYGPRYYGHSWYGGHWYHGWYGGNPGWWWLVGGTWFLYPEAVYPYPDPNVQPLASIPAPPAGQNSPYWYWCGNPAGYYPYVSRCLVPFQPVAAGVQVNAPPPAGTEQYQQQPQLPADQPPLPAPPPGPPGSVPNAAPPP